MVGRVGWVRGGSEGPESGREDGEENKGNKEMKACAM
jgi:hypothetical protein